MATGGTGKQKEDPTEKIQKMIGEAITKALGDRDQTEKEAKDPWARIEGVIDRTIAKHFQAFAQGLEEGMAKEGKPKGGKADDDEGEGGILGLFGS
jgi:hypothetical protein